MWSDVSAIGISIFAAYVATLPVTARRTFGYYRAEILAALLNGLTLWLVAGVIFREAYDRFQSPPEVQGSGAILIATVGLLINGLTAWILHGTRSASLNLRGVMLHVLSDALGSVAAIAAGIIIVLTGWYWVDPAISIGIGVLILASSFSLIRESINILMQTAPPHLNPVDLQRRLESLSGVTQIHDLHVWTLTSGVFTLSAHAVVDGDRDPHALLDALERTIRHDFGIDHITIQLETRDRRSGEPQHF